MEETETQEKKVPKVSFANDEVVVETFNIPLVVNDNEVIIKMKKLTAGERRDLIKKNSPIKLVGNQPTGNIDMVGYQIGVLSKVIVEAPFPVTEQVISSFPTEVLDYLFEEYDKLTDNKKKV